MTVTEKGILNLNNQSQQILRNRINKIIKNIFAKPEMVFNTFFGEMTDAGSYYECRRIFRVTNTLVEIGLEKTVDDSKEKQIAFFEWLEENYSLVIEKITPPFEKEVQSIIPDYKVVDFKKELVIDYLFIPKCEEDEFEWQISFDEVNRLQHFCSFFMLGLTVKNILIEG